MDLQRIAEDTQQKVLQYLDSDGWQVSSKSTKGVTIELRPATDFEGTLYRCTKTVDGNYEEMYKYLTPNTVNWKAEWDKDTALTEVLQQIDENTQVIRRATYSLALGLISSRDLVELVRSQVTDTHALVTAVSVDMPDFPPVEKHVRAWAYPWGIRCLKVSENSTKLQAILQVDLKGKLPTSLVESTIPSLQLGLFKNYENYLKEKGVIKPAK